MQAAEEEEMETVEERKETVAEQKGMVEKGNETAEDEQEPRWKEVVVESWKQVVMVLWW